MDQCPASMGPRLFSRGNAGVATSYLPSELLQWGHDFSAVEMTAWTLKPLNPCSLLQWGHDFSAVEIASVLFILANWPTSFNGATTFQPWKWCYRYWILPKCCSFNGATTFQPWKWRESCRPWAGRDQLQWGHDFSAVEIVMLRSKQSFKSIASMGPRLFSRGNSIRICGSHHAGCASMGPRLFSRGNPGAGGGGERGMKGFNGATTFQPWKW